MRKASFAIAVLATLGCASLTTSASAAPGAPMGVTAPEATTKVGMMHHDRMMHHRMMRHKMMRHRMMRHRMMHRM